jgi:hypothetical protein
LVFSLFVAVFSLHATQRSFSLSFFRKQRSFSRPFFMS